MNTVDPHELAVLLANMGVPAAESAEMARVSANFDCQKCGACCASRWLVDVEWQDDEVPLHMIKDDRLFGTVMRERKGQCIALKGKIGCSVKCSIYTKRPRVCQAFLPGSHDCLLARRLAGVQDQDQELSCNDRIRI